MVISVLSLVLLNFVKLCSIRAADENSECYFCCFFILVRPLNAGECGQDGFSHREVESNHRQPGTETGIHTYTVATLNYLPRYTTSISFS